MFKNKILKQPSLGKSSSTLLQTVGLTLGS